IHYAGFLGVMDTGQALTRFFQRDSTKANNLTLYPHKEEEFWLWLASWAVFLQTPADLGYPADGYDLPDLDLEFHQVTTDPSRIMKWDRDGQGTMAVVEQLGGESAAAEKRETIDLRVVEMMSIIDATDVGNSGDQVVSWCHHLGDQYIVATSLSVDTNSWSQVHGLTSIDELERRIA